MIREEYIKAIKAKLEEVSPFEGGAFIASDDRANEVKPITSYIESELDKATEFCLNTLPLTLLADDTDTDNMHVSINEKGVGVIKDVYDYWRLVRLSCSTFDRDVISFISSSDQVYTLQQNKYTRGGVAKPVAAYVPENARIEVYSFPNNTIGAQCQLTYIDTHVRAERVQSHVEKYIVLRCAMVVARILGDINTAQLFEKEWAEEVAPLLK